MSVEDIGVKFNDAFIMASGFRMTCAFRPIEVVVPVVVRREGIRHFQMTLCNGNLNTGRVNSFAILLSDNGYIINAWLCEGKRGFFFVSGHDGTWCLVADAPYNGGSFVQLRGIGADACNKGRFGSEVLRCGYLSTCIIGIGNFYLYACENHQGGAQQNQKAWYFS